MELMHFSTGGKKKGKKSQLEENNLEGLESCQEGKKTRRSVTCN